MYPEIDFTNSRKIFNNVGAIVLTNLLSKELCQVELEKLFLECARGNLEVDSMCKSPSTYEKSFGLHDNLLCLVQPKLEKFLGMKLYPSYSYSRLYMNGDSLLIHTDRVACEISLTINLGYQGDCSWPIWFMDRKTSKKYSTYEYGDINYRGENKDDFSLLTRNETQSTNLNVGDAFLYKGCEIYHWRYPLEESSWQGQVFLHYVDANGPYAEWKYNKRERLGV